MVRIFVFFVCLTTSFTLQAWSTYTHALIVKESLADVAQEWDLDKPVLITSFQQFLEKFSQENPDIKTRENFAEWLKINPNSHFDQLHKKYEKIGEWKTPLEILSLCAPRADDGRDTNLPYDKVEQLWFGKGARSTSQAFRHMEKPAFNPLHPLNTFGFPLGKIGQATQRAQIYFDLALKAHQLGEPYWAWNFLGVGLHYIEDLGQPYHAAQLLPPLAFKGIQAYFQWGLKEKKDFVKTVTHVVSNAHHYFEGYVDYFLEEKQDLGKPWRKALRDKTILHDISSIRSLAKKIRNESNRLALVTVNATFQMTGKSLLTSKLYDVWGESDEYPENPIPYLSPNHEDRLKGSAQISKIVLSSFETQGKVIRTVIHSFLRATKEGF